MKMFRGPSKILIVLALFIFVGISCNLPMVQRQYSNDLIPVSTEAVESLQSEIQEIFLNGQTISEFVLTISEEEITSLVAFELAKLPNHIIQSPQIYLRDGKIKIIAKYVQGSFQTPLQLNIIVEADNSGYPIYQIESGKLGPIVMPESLREQIEAQIDDILVERIFSRNKRILIQSFHISDGLMTIKGLTP